MTRWRHSEVSCLQIHEWQEELGLKYRQSGPSIHLFTMTLSCLHWSGSLQAINEARVPGLEQLLSPEQRTPSDSDSVWQSAAFSSEGPQTAAVWISSSAIHRSLCCPPCWVGLSLWILQKANTKGPLLSLAVLTLTCSSFQAFSARVHISKIKMANTTGNWMTVIKCDLGKWKWYGLQNYEKILNSEEIREIHIKLFLTYKWNKL